MKTPKLIKINMRRADGSNHPDIDCRKNYLVRVGGNFYAGKFERQWYGLNFVGIYDAGCQFDALGTNASSWQDIWEIRL